MSRTVCSECGAIYTSQCDCEIAALRSRLVRLEEIERCARELFRALDYVTPGWRDETCVITEDSDEVNVAWCGLENVLENPKAGQPPEAF